MCMLSLQCFNFSRVVWEEEIGEVASTLSFQLLSRLHYQPELRQQGWSHCASPQWWSLWCRLQMPAGPRLALRESGCWEDPESLPAHCPGSLKATDVGDLYIRCQSWSVTTAPFMCRAQAGSNLEFLIALLYFPSEWDCGLATPCLLLNLLLNRHINLTQTFYFLVVLACRPFFFFPFPSLHQGSCLWSSDLHNGRIKLISIEA